jgi:hypothetical protein
MRKNAPRWINENEWACPVHCPAARLPASLERCWYSNCSVRPPMEDRPVPVCAWEGCDAPQRENSKYCSKNCSNKNARKLYLERKRRAA